MTDSASFQQLIFNENSNPSILDSYKNPSFMPKIPTTHIIWNTASAVSWAQPDLLTLDRA